MCIRDRDVTVNVFLNVKESQTSSSDVVETLTITTNPSSFSPDAVVKLDGIVSGSNNNTWTNVSKGNHKVTVEPAAGQNVLKDASGNEYYSYNETVAVDSNSLAISLVKIEKGTLTVLVKDADGNVADAQVKVLSLIHI